MSVAESFNPASINLSARAVRKVRELVAEEENQALKLRVYITGGGCSGFQYGFSFEEDAAEDDAAIEKDGVTVLVDPMSFQYLVGSEVDYTEGLEGSRFIVNNPNAATTCGCASVPAKDRGPFIAVSVHTTICIALSGVIHGPPAIAQPGQFCIVKRKPSLRHSSAAWRTAPSQGSLKHRICGSTPGHAPPN